jgi:hypothetical protein
VLQSLQRDEAEPKLRQVVCRGRDRERAIREVMRSYDPWQIVSAEPELVGGIFGFFQREALVITVDESARPPAAPTSSALVDAFLEEARDDVVLDATSPGQSGPTPEKSFDQVLGEVVSSLGEEPGEYRPRPSPPRTPAPAPTDVVYGRAPRTGHDAAARWAVACDTARACGVPNALIPAAVPEGAPPRLESVFCHLPVPPPLPKASGGLVAVVGSSPRSGGTLFGVLEAAGSVRPSAQAIARATGCDEEDIALVCEQMPDRAVPPGLLARDAAEVASLAPGWRRDRTGVAAVYAPALGDSQQWVREVLHAMRPSSVVAVVSATTKPEDVARWVRAIGGADALALVDVRRTCTPGAALSIGVPVLSLDGEAATPSCWAKVCAASS